MPTTAGGDGPPADSATPPAQRSSLRRWLALIFVFLACLVVVLSALVIWAHQVLLKPSRTASIIEPSIRDPAVQQALSVRISDQLVQGLQIQQRAQDALPGPADFLAAPLTNAAQTILQRETYKLLTNKDFQDLLLQAIQRADTSVVGILRNENANIQIENNQVVLNLFPLIDRVLQRLSESKLVPKAITVPDLTQPDNPAASRQQLSQALGVQVPADFGVVTLFSSDTLSQAQTAVKLADVLVILVPLLALALIAAAIAVSQDRRRTVIQLGLGIAIAMLLAHLLLRLGGNWLVSQTKGGSAANSVAREVVDELVHFFAYFTVALIILGLLAALIAFAFGRRAWLLGGWRGLVEGVRRLPTSAATQWTGRHVDVLRIAGTAVAAVVLLILHLSWASLLTVLILLLLYQLGLSWIHDRVEGEAAPAQG